MIFETILITEYFTNDTNNLRSIKLWSIDRGKNIDYQSTIPTNRVSRHSSLVLETSRVPAYNCYVSNQHRYNPGYTDSRNVWFWLAPQTCPAFLARSAAAALITTRTHPQPFRWSPAKPIAPSLYPRNSCSRLVKIADKVTFLRPSLKFRRRGEKFSHDFSLEIYIFF